MSDKTLITCADHACAAVSKKQLPRETLLSQSGRCIVSGTACVCRADGVPRPLRHRPGVTLAAIGRAPERTANAIGAPSYVPRATTIANLQFHLFDLLSSVPLWVYIVVRQPAICYTESLAPGAGSPKRLHHLSRRPSAAPFGEAYSGKTSRRMDGCPRVRDFSP